MNICHRVEVDRIFKQYRPDTVMHLVAEPHVDQCVDGAADFIHTNIGGTYTLLEPARDYWMRLFLPGVRFGCVGADAVYGKAPQFRRSLAERALLFAVGILPQQRVYPADVVMRPPVRKRPGVRPPVHPTPSVESIQAQAMIASLGEDAF